MASGVRLCTRSLARLGRCALVLTLPLLIACVPTKDPSADVLDEPPLNSPPSQTEKAKAEKNERSSLDSPATQRPRLVDRGIFSDLDPGVKTECPSWFGEGPLARFRDPETNHGWLAIDGSVVCEDDGRTTAYADLAIDGKTLGDRDEDGIVDALDILRGAKKTVLNGAHYKNAYLDLDYPGGDVPRDQGVCTDVIVRALRNFGLDLQVALQEDLKARPGAYPMVKKPDSNIDHRRVRTLLPYFQGHLPALPTDPKVSKVPFLPGDILFMNTMGDSQPEHMGIVSDRVGKSGHPLVVNNWNEGTQTSEMDLLGWVPVTHRFRFGSVPKVASQHVGLKGVLARHQLMLPADARQLVLVTTPLWSSTQGQLRRYARPIASAPFTLVGKGVPIFVGKSGLGRGLGLHGGTFLGPGEKREGDGKSPAGAFKFGTAFGRSSALRIPSRWPYRQITDRDYFVDAPSSDRYNSWVTLAPGQQMTESAEHLMMYEWGLVVEHNTHPPVPGAGSAIFLHVGERPTVGCTALTEAHLMDLLEWLDPDANPVLVQVADRVYR